MLSVKRESLSNSLKNISANLWRHVAHIALLVGVVSSSPRPALFPCFVSAAWRTISPPFRSACRLAGFCRPVVTPWDRPFFGGRLREQITPTRALGLSKIFFAKFTPVGGTMLENRPSTGCAPFRAGFLCYAFSVGRATAHRRNHCRRWTTCRRSAKA